MKKTIFTGAATAIITPMNPDFSINYETFGKLIDFQIDEGIDAIVVCGTTGEASTMTDEEHIEVIKYCVNRVAKRVPVIAGTGSNDTLYATELSKAAEAAGADALLLVTPYYNKTSQRGLVKHFSHTADAVNIPIMLYNVPSRTGISIGIEAYKELSKHPMINATKEASGDFSLIAKIFAECGEDLNVYSGNDDQFLPMIAMGGKGVISVLSNVIPKVTAKIAKLSLDGNYPEAAALMNKYLELANNLFIDTNPIPVKQAAAMMKLCDETMRLPLIPMEEAKTAKLKATLDKLGLL
ncbi:MAG: 4-hydroxy-tetrahydrodipicolinate synthase [Ruminococcus sp.]|jgi:4-hydroxy-tetrahydrodipicolinate synthase|nr:4-hydroxy-tetrahydrodipicolinate synthase [Ruminococcus sp.]